MADPAPSSTRRVCYLHGRPGPHPLHGRFARAVGGEFRYIDFRLRWQDRDRSRLYTLLSWLLCAVFFPDRRRFDVFLVDNLHVYPALMKKWFLGRSQKIVVHLGSHTLYFLRSGRFSPTVTRLHLRALRSYDALICEGEMARELAVELLGDDCPPTYLTFLGPPRERARALHSNEPDFGSRRILVIANGPGDFRVHYKGIDLMIEGFARAAADDPELELHLLGEWDDGVLPPLVERLAPGAAERIHIHGRVDGIEDFLARSQLLLHCSRGDAFPTATIEALAAGLVPIVSEWTGTKEVVARVDPRLVTPAEPEAVARALGWFFALPEEERRALSRAGRAAAGPYTEEAATRHYVATFERLCDDIGARSSGG